jgi:AcrR family transcriptional regulator
VLDAALAIADAEGLGAVTMQAVAARLGVTPMALYRHVGDKGELLDGLVERLLAELPVPGSDVGWAERLAELGTGMRRTARRHPHVFPLLLARPAVTQDARGVRDAVYDALAEAGVPPARVARVERIVSTAVLGFAASEVGGRLARHSRRVLDADFAGLLRMLQSFISSEAT